jgi:hypothetical protein
VHRLNRDFPQLVLRQHIQQLSLFIDEDLFFDSFKNQQEKNRLRSEIVAWLARRA